MCRTDDELGRAVGEALAISRQEHLVVEQYLEGTHHGYTCFIVDGRVGFWFADDEQYFVNRYLVSGTTTPTSMAPESLAELSKAVETLASSLQLVDGLMHVQCIETVAGPRIIEITRRCPGDLYPRFVELATGFPYAETIARAEAGMPIPAETLPTEPAFIARHCIMAERNGVVRGVRIDPRLEPRMVERMLWWSEGREITRHLSEKLGIVFMRFDDLDEMRQTSLDFNTLIEVSLS